MSFNDATRKAAVLIILGAAMLLLAFGMVSCSRKTEQGGAASQEVQLWYCPMHPTQTSDKPGDCPICQMRLVPLIKKPPPPATGGSTTEPPGVGGSARPAGSTGEPLSGARTIYRSTMIPSETSDHPGKDSMGMEMVPVEAGPIAGGSPEGWAGVEISPERLQKTGVTFGRVVVKSVARTIHTVGRIAIDETRVHHIHTKFSGWIEEIAADYVGKAVRRGDLLFTIYSPEVLASQEEYLQARRNEQELAKAASDPELLKGARDLAQAAWRRLDLLDVDPAVIAGIEWSGQVRRTLPIYSPISGIVMEKTAQHGMYVNPETEEFLIADTSSVWVLADVYESEISEVRVGQAAQVTLTYDPGRVHNGRITYIYPTLDPGTRTAKARIELDNPRGELKPDMIADVALRTDAGLRTVIPKPAVLMTGDKAIAFVDLGNGRLAPREISVGLRFDDDLEVLSGLAPGERVVTSANFLIDSESRLRSALAGAAPKPGAGNGP